MACRLGEYSWHARREGFGENAKGVPVPLQRATLFVKCTHAQDLAARAAEWWQMFRIFQLGRPGGSLLSCVMCRVRDLERQAHQSSALSIRTSGFRPSCGPIAFHLRPVHPSLAFRDAGVLCAHLPDWIWEQRRQILMPRQRQAEAHVQNSVTSGLQETPVSVEGG